MAEKTRLRLDFSLSSAEDRKAFLDKYLTNEIFKKRPPTPDELTVMANYLLWGKDSTGKNAKQSDGIFIETKHGTWDKDNVESLDELVESPTFVEAALSELGTTQFRTKKETFSREAALEKAPPHARAALTTLFHDIDKLDLLITFYELAHGKRTAEPRKSLISQFSTEEINEMREAISHWNQYKYLRQRHLLVEMRREQYTLRDSFQEAVQSRPTFSYSEDNFDFDVGIEVLPLGLYQEEGVAALPFQPLNSLNPKSFSEEDLEEISQIYWKKKKFVPSANQKYFDFRDENHVYCLLCAEGELSAAAEDSDVSSNLAALLRTLQYYIDRANLSEMQKEILQMKLDKRKNNDIADEINRKYGKSYLANYISTIFKQRIVSRICAAASLHENTVANLFFEEEFKRCTMCKVRYLRCADNFTRKSRSPDGYSTRCKRCEKELRRIKQE